ncbi:MAG: TonB-dependent receptor [Ignavibacteria bacterium]|nr:TonB-dependent receptor [Ignavibacteria bacterium]
MKQEYRSFALPNSTPNSALMKFSVACILGLVVMCLSSQLAKSQGVTTGSIQGVVYGDESAEGGSASKKIIIPLIGATVKAVHDQTLAVYGQVTRSDGRYTLRGLRPGSYKITVTYVSFKPSEKTSVNVEVGETKTLDFTLVQTSSTTADVVVVAEQDALFSSSKNGSGSVINSATITAAPTINRSISDMARINPYTNQTQTNGSDGLQGLSIMGVNSRFNNFQIDGAVANDVFALGAAGTAGSQANSNFVSLDAIEQLKINVSPYDVRQGGFTGGLINAITRGGTNTFTGSAFLYGRNQDLVGNSPDVYKRPFDSFHDVSFGGRVGGPIIEKELWFHVTMEGRFRSTPIEVALNDPKALNNFSVPSSALDEIITISKNSYGYNPGTYDVYNNRNNSFNIIARLDWDVNDKNKLQLRHNYTNGIQDRNLSRDAFNYSLSSRVNTFTSISNQSVLQWNSIVSGATSNELRLSYTQTNDERVLPAQPFPEVRIQVGSGQNVVFGPERNSQANALDQTIIALTNDFTVFEGNHTFTFGTHNELSRFNNLFIADYTSSLQYPSIDAFRDSTANYYRVSYANTAVTNGDVLPRTKWSMLQAGVYAMDEWQVSPGLRITGGARLDVPIYLSTPYSNDTFAVRFPGLNTSVVPQASLLWSPRVGFNYDINGDKSFQIRGGTGLFTGRVAAVWLSNQYSNTGVDIFRAQLGGNNSQSTIVDATTKLPVRWDLNAPPLKPGDAGYPGLPIATSAINITDKDFKIPQVWRSTIAFDKKLTQGVSVTIEAMYGSFLNQVAYQNLNLKRSKALYISNGDTVRGVSPLDGRPLYAGETPDSLVAKEFTQVIRMSSRNAGYQYSLSAQLSIDERNKILPGVSATMGYVFGHSQDLTSAQSATALSQWNGTDAIDPNNVTIARSSFDVPHRFVVNTSYKFQWSKDIATTIGLFYSGSTGQTYSLSYAQDYNGDNAVGGNDLIYVPRAEDYGTKIVVVQPTGTDLRTPAQVWAQVMALIDANPVLKQYQGQILPRNAVRVPWVNTLDGRLTQRLPGLSNHKIDITLDIQNILNLFNSNWGLQRYVNFQSANLLGLGVVNGKPFDDQGRLRMTYSEPVTNGQPGVYVTDNFYSRWRMQLGVRYTF